MGPRAPEGMISARMLQRVAARCRAQGHDTDAMCGSVGLSPSVLADPGAVVPYEVAFRFGERALALTRDESFGLHLAGDVGDTRGFDAGLLLLMASPSVRAAIERMARHQRYWGDGERATIVTVRGGLAVRYALPGAAGVYMRHADECAMAEIALGLRVLSGWPLNARVVRFRHPSPPSTSEHRAVFGCPIDFGAAHTEIVLDDAVLDTPMAHANEAFAAIFEGQVERALAGMPASAGASEGVRAAARAALGAGGCSLAGTARSLGMSTRTLQRRLQAEGTSFGALVDAVRRETALACIDRGVSIAEIAALLGYADATAFHHAFRRWTGKTPLGRSPADPTPG